MEKGMDKRKPEVCAWCNVSIIGGSITKLECNHIFHARCAHGPLTRGASHCIACTKTRVTTAASSEFRRLDFGDDWEQRNDTLSYEENLSMIKNIPGPVPLRVDLDRVSIALSLREQEKGGSNANGFLGKLESMSGVAEALGIRHEDDLASLIKDRTPSGILVRDKRIDAESLWRKGVTLEQIMDSGYEIRDLVVLKATWRDLMMLQLTSDVWRKHKKKLPVMEVIKIYKITIHDILNMCGYSTSSIASIGFTIVELKALKTTMQLLLDMCLSKESMIMFGFSMEEWRDFGLTFDNLVRMQVSIGDLYERTQEGYQGLGWVDVEHRQAKLQRFSHAFGYSSESLPAQLPRFISYDNANVRYAPSLNPPPSPNPLTHPSLGSEQLQNGLYHMPNNSYPMLSSREVSHMPSSNSAYTIITAAIVNNINLTDQQQDAIYEETNQMFQGGSIAPMAQKTLEITLSMSKATIPDNGWFRTPPQGVDIVRAPHIFFTVEGLNRPTQTFLLTSEKPILRNVTPSFLAGTSYPTLS